MFTQQIFTECPEDCGCINEQNTEDSSPEVSIKVGRERQFSDTYIKWQ